MLLGAALVLVGAAVLYFAVTGRDPRSLVASLPVPGARRRAASPGQAGRAGRTP